MTPRHGSSVSSALRALREARVAQLAVAFLYAGSVLSAVELLVVGKLTVPSVGLLAIGAALLPAGIISHVIAVERLDDEESGADDEGEGGGGGGGGSKCNPEPLPPKGGLAIDWDRFERDFRTYSEAAADSERLVARV
jgi:hypothetical protein